MSRFIIEALQDDEAVTSQTEAFSTFTGSLEGRQEQLIYRPPPGYSLLRDEPQVTVEDKGKEKLPRPESL